MQPIDKYLPEFPPKYKVCFQHSDEWRRDIQQQINEIRELVDMALFRITTVESHQSSLSHKVHNLRYAGDDE